MKYSSNKYAYFLKIATTVGCLGVLSGMMVSRVMLSISMVVLVIIALFSGDLKNKVKAFIRHPEWFLISGFVVMILLSGIYSTDKIFLINRLRIKLPLLVLPFAFWALKPFDKRQYFLILWYFFMLVSVGAAWSVIQYALDYRQLTNSYHYAKVIPTPVNHIRFSLMIAFSILTGAILFARRFYIKWKFEKWLILFLTLFQLIVLHILAVRSGLAALYLAAIVLLIYNLVRWRRFVYLLILIIGIPAFMAIAYKAIPTLDYKIDYMLYDYQVYKEGGTQVPYSDTRRLQSMEAGIRAGNESPIIGNGYGDIKLAIDAAYQKIFPEVKEKDRLLPHNQFIYIYCGMGIMGLLYFLAMFFWPFFKNHNYRDPLFLGLQVILFTSFMTEATIEAQIGTAFYVFFILLIMKFLADQTYINPAKR